MNDAPQLTTIAALRQRIARLEGIERPPAVFSSGLPALDALLPGGGLSPGTLVEWLSRASGDGTASLALLAAREACRRGGALVVLDRRAEFYPPAALAFGISPGELILVRARSVSDELWALDQALRCPGVAAALAWPEKLDPQNFRRLQLAVEQNGGLGLLVRPHAVRGTASWAHVRWLVEPCPGGGQSRRLRLTLLRCRGGADGARVEVEIDDECAKEN